MDHFELCSSTHFHGVVQVSHDVGFEKPGSIVPGLGEGLHGLLDNLKLSPIHLE